MKKWTHVSVAFLLAVLSGCNGGGDVSLKTDEQKTFYAVGVMFGQRLKGLEPSDDELKALEMGLRHSAKGVESKVDLAQYQMKVQELFRARIKKSTDSNKKKGEDYIANFLKEEGAKKTESGLAYKMLKEGTGKAPSGTDNVEVHYHGTLIDGQVFDSSVERGKTVSFPLNRVIKGWTEGLQLVKEGGKIRLVIPSELAYGDAGAPPKIPGGSTLVFDVELFKVGEAPAPAAHKMMKPKGKGHKKGKK